MDVIGPMNVTIMKFFFMQLVIDIVKEFMSFSYKNLRKSTKGFERPLIDYCLL